MTMQRRIDRDDILPMDEYVKIRKTKRSAVVARKADRRMAIGPIATFYFENYETMWLQIHEMLYIERGGEEQIEDELRAYNPLIPQGRELKATLMFEIEDPARRKALLSKMGWVEDTVSLKIGDLKIQGIPQDDVDRTTADGKTSAVHFMTFPFTDEEAAAFKAPGAQVILAIAHENYGHMAVLPETVRAALAEDLD